MTTKSRHRTESAAKDAARRRAREIAAFARSFYSDGLGQTWRIIARRVGAAWGYEEEIQLTLGVQTLFVSWADEWPPPQYRQESNR